MHGNPQSCVAKAPYHRGERPARVEKVPTGNVPFEEVPDIMKKSPFCWKSPRKSWKRSESPWLKRKSSENPCQYPYYCSYIIYIIYSCNNEGFTIDI